MKTDLVVSAYIVHEKKILLIMHKKLGKWLPPGGHIEADETPDDAVLRESLEEVGLELELLNKSNLLFHDKTTQQLAIPFHVEIHSVGDHYHCCFFYLCRAKNLSSFKLNMDEANGSAWFSRDELQKVTHDVRQIALKALDLSQNI